MNLRFIEAFVWVARLHSFTAASEKLCTTQTAISARIAALESEFGVRLFERDKRSVTLTPAGEELLTHAEQLLGISARMLETVADRTSYGGTLAIGAIEAVVHTWLPELLRRVRQSFPMVRVEIHSYMTRDLHAQLLKGHIDVALTAEPLLSARAENRPICAFEMRWVTGRHADRNEPTLNGDRLERLPILTFLRDSLVYRDVISKLGPYASARINPISSIAAMVALVKSGYGMATLPHAAVWREVESGELVTLDVEPRLAPLPLVASIRNPSESPIAHTVVHLAGEAAATFASGPLVHLVTVQA